MHLLAGYVPLWYLIVVCIGIACAMFALKGSA
jgi:hypothetical protein